MANRVDISENAREYRFEFNEKGLSVINKVGYTQLGIRGGYELLPEIPNNGISTELNLLINSETASDVNMRPVLSIVYSLPSTTAVCGNNIIEQGEQCDDGDTINGDGCSSSCQVESQQSQCNSGADTNENGNIDNVEIENYVQRFYNDEIGIVQVSNAIMEYLNGCW